MVGHEHHHDDECTAVLSQMNKVLDSIKNCYHRIEVLEGQLRHRNLTLEERTNLEKELEDVKDAVVISESQLKSLRQENRKSFVLALMTMCLLVLIYVIYSTMENE